ncbi:helix-turn-helix domain-containing protein [Streptomyces spinosus]|uniref:helix-turn-helix domain-containing protein n=1 Tax=Streptomyces spinosus TaxID=2872623 RepID=UPI001CED78B5|nr:XRE family transcriptional regulator [Streptomyces spinosus]
MPRWKALPEDLDPQMREFTVRLRQLADRGGLNTAALADRTGYGKTSWERYLDGRLLAPKGAVIALAEATGTDPGPLTTLWERAERSWTRAESNDDHTFQAIDITDSRAALGDLAGTGKTARVPGTKPAGPTGGTGGRDGATVRRAGGPADGTAGAVSAGSAGVAGGKSAGATVKRAAGAAGAAATGTSPRASGGPDGRKDAGTGEGGGLAAARAIAGPAGVPPRIPAQPAASQADGIRDGVPDGTATGGDGGGGDGSATAGESGRGTAPGAGPDAADSAGTASSADARTASGDAEPPVRNSWGVAGYRGPSKASVRPGTRPGPARTPSSSPLSPDTPARSPGLPAGTPGVPARFPDAAGGGPNTSAWPPGLTVGTPAVPPRTPGLTAGTPTTALRTPAVPAAAPAGPARTPGGAGGAAGGRRWSVHRQQVAMFFAGLVGVGVLIAGFLFVTRQGGDGRDAGARTPASPSAPARPSPPPGVKCVGASCTGKDAEAMGCSGDLVSTAKTATVGTTTLEVRYSKTCGTAWGRITGGAPGDTVRVTVGKVRQTGDITAVGDTIGYTPMVAVHGPAQARACATLASGETGCTD